MTTPNDSTHQPRGDLLSPFLDEELFPEEAKAPHSAAIGMLADESPFLRDLPQARPDRFPSTEALKDWEGTEASEEAGTEVEEVQTEGRLEEEAGEETIEFEEPREQSNTYFRIANDITSAFEGGKPDTLNLIDNGIISYGKHQATLASGSLFLILKRYAQLSRSEAARSLSPYLDRVRRKDATLRADKTFFGLLRSAAHEPAMQQAQDKVFAEHYWKPAKKAAKSLGIRSALGYVLLYNVRVQGGLLTVIKLAKKRAGGKVGDIVGGQPISEARFLSAFVDAFIAHRLQNSASNAAKAAKLREEVAVLERQGLGSSRQAAEKRAQAKRNERNAKALKASATKTRGPSFRALVDFGDLDLRGDANGIVRLAGKPGAKIRGLRPGAKADEVPSEYEEEWAVKEGDSYLTGEDDKIYPLYTPEVEEYKSEPADTEEPYSSLLESEPEEWAPGLAAEEEEDFTDHELSDDDFEHGEFEDNAEASDEDIDPEFAEETEHPESKAEYNEEEENYGVEEGELDPVLVDLMEETIAREFPLVEHQVSTQWTKCFSAQDIAKVQKVYEDNAAAASLNENDRCNCIVMLQVAIGQLLPLRLKRLRANSRKKGKGRLSRYVTNRHVQAAYVPIKKEGKLEQADTIEKTMQHPRLKRFTVFLWVTNFFDQKNRTAGNQKPERLKASVKDKVLANSNKEGCWFAFALSIMDGYHSALLLVDRTAANAKIYLLDQHRSTLVNDVTNLDQWLTTHTRGAWDDFKKYRESLKPKPKYTRSKTIIRLWQLRKQEAP